MHFRKTFHVLSNEDNLFKYQNLSKQSVSHEQLKYLNIKCKSIEPFHELVFNCEWNDVLRELNADKAYNNFVLKISGHHASAFFYCPTQKAAEIKIKQ